MSFPFAASLALAKAAPVHPYTLHHYRDKDQDEVDIIVENEQGAMVGIEVKQAQPSM
jgi:predicted AAA+ superfamily ATPase